MIEAWHAKEKHYLLNRGFGFVAAGYFPGDTAEVDHKAS